MVRSAGKLSVVVVGVCLAARAVFADAPAVPTPPQNPPAQAAAPTGPSPRIKFDETNVNLGEVVRGQDAVATFTYRNTGEVPLHIVSVKPG